MTHLIKEGGACSHNRLDLPEIDDENWRAWINIFRDDQGEMQLEKQAFDDWPARI